MKLPIVSDFINSHTAHIYGLIVLEYLTLQIVSGFTFTEDTVILSFFLSVMF